MAGSEFKTVATGDPVKFSAWWINRVTDAARAFAQTRHQQTVPPTTMGDDEGLVYVQNNSGADVQRFGVLGIGGVLIDSATNLPEFQNNWALTGTTPTTAAYTGKFVITREPIKLGAIGKAWLFGACPVQVYIVTGGDPCADVTDSDTTKLTSGPSGAAQILWAAGGPGLQWCIVRFMGSGSNLPAGTGLYKSLQLGNTSPFPNGGGVDVWDWMRAH